MELFPLLLSTIVIKIVVNFPTQGSKMAFYQEVLEFTLIITSWPDNFQICFSAEKVIIEPVLGFFEDFCKFHVFLAPELTFFKNKK